LASEAGRPAVRFVLASASPARLATLRQAGVQPEVIVSGVDEDAISADTTSTLVTLLATAKARAVAAGIGPGALVLGCDSLLELDGRALGKPGSEEAARLRWRQMRARTATLWTGHHLIDTTARRTAGRAVGTEVRFADASDAEIDAYCATGEPTAVAGAFTIDGLGGWFIEGVDGDHHNVVGVSLPALRSMLHELGHDLTTIGYPTR
jgi:septum formation protein